MANQEVTYWVVPVVGWDKINPYPVTVESISDGGEAFTYREPTWEGFKLKREIQGVNLNFFKTEEEARNHLIELHSEAVRFHTWKIEQLKLDAAYFDQFKVNSNK